MWLGLALCTLMWLCVRHTDAHVRLTFPPARKYDLDFLDVVRTPPPCGMSKGLGPVTNFLVNEQVSVTWHLAYPHTGGYRINLLNQSEHTVYSFTSGFVGLDDPTKLSHNIIIPNIPCMNCSIQLIRQAGEWTTSCNNGKYDFYSCADVNIKSAIDYNVCNHGTMMNGTCLCDRLYTGPTCLQQEECQADSDCNNGGRCFTGVSTTSPKNNCYCAAGYFGRHCEKRSTVSSLANTTKAGYITTDIHPDFKMFHKVLTDIGEIEVLLQVRTDTWVGVGWRPSGYLSGCRRFPVLPPFPDRDAGPEM